MVRFKNRFLLVEFLSPADLAIANAPVLPNPGPPALLQHNGAGTYYGGMEVDHNYDGDDDGGTGSGREGEGKRDAEEDGDEDDDVVRFPSVPFLLPRLSDLQPGSNGNGNGIGIGVGDGGNRSGDAGSAIFRTVRTTIQEVFGDEGWGRVASSFKVVYHSTLTSLTILRVARQHYRLVWAATSLLTQLAGVPVLPRVVAVSGTIKKAENHAIAYHRRIVASMLAVMAQRDRDELRAGKLKDRAGREEKELEQLVE